MASLAPPFADPLAARPLWQHLVSVAVLALIVALFASVGTGLPSTVEALAPPRGQPPIRGTTGFIATDAGPPVPAPESDPEALAPLSAGDAMARNAALPLSGGPNPAASAFHIGADEITRMRSIDCMTAAIYYEAGLEPLDGQRAVAQVVLNRVRHPAYPKTVCGVVFQGAERATGCQFSFTCSGMLSRTPNPALWERVRRVAQAALDGYVFQPVGLATHYHADYVFPVWAPTLSKIIQIGHHIFYRWGPPSPSIFTGRYAGAEPNINWRGGFGQPERAVLVAIPPINSNNLTIPAEDPAHPGEPPPSPDSFAGAVLHRYEPVNSANAGQIIDSRIPAASANTPSSRWALSGRQSDTASTQRPLGRAEPPAPPVILQGIRRRAPGEPAPAPAPANSAQPR